MYSRIRIISYLFRSTHWANSLESNDMHGTSIDEIGTRLPTGTPGLDIVLHGGLTPNRLYLVEGTPGSGKTTLALKFLMDCREQGNRSLYITLSEVA